MKLYNPFKPHLVKIGNHYAIRRLESCGWTYLDKESLDKGDVFWWGQGKVRYYLFEGIADAREVFEAKPWKAIVLET